MDRTKSDRWFLVTLIYGLFHPMCNVIEGDVQQKGEQPAQRKATRWTREVLQEMAFQLRMLRRRGVYPSFLSIFLFFVAYAVSLVLAFADIGERMTAHSLAFGILISRFSIFPPAILDRSRELISRWMWNAEAARQWVDSPNQSAPPNWWSQRT